MKRVADSQLTSDSRYTDGQGQTPAETPTPTATNTDIHLRKIKQPKRRQVVPGSIPPIPNPFASLKPSAPATPHSFGQTPSTFLSLSSTNATAATAATLSPFTFNPSMPLSSAGGGSFSFGSTAPPPTTGFTFGSAANSSKTDNASPFAGAPTAASSAPTTSFSFGSASSSPFVTGPAPVTTAPSPAQFSFSNPSTASSVAALASESSASKPSGTFSFSSSASSTTVPTSNFTTAPSKPFDSTAKPITGATLVASAFAPATRFSFSVPPPPATPVAAAATSDMETDHRSATQSLMPALVPSKPTTTMSNMSTPIYWSRVKEMLSKLHGLNTSYTAHITIMLKSDPFADLENVSVEYITMRQNTLEEYKDVADYAVTAKASEQKNDSLKTTLTFAAPAASMNMSSSFPSSSMASAPLKPSVTAAAFSFGAAGGFGGTPAIPNAFGAGNSSATPFGKSSGTGTSFGSTPNPFGSASTMSMSFGGSSAATTTTTNSFSGGPTNLFGAPSSTPLGFSSSSFQFGGAAMAPTPVTLTNGDDEDNNDGDADGDGENSQEPPTDFSKGVGEEDEDIIFEAGEVKMSTQIASPEGIKSFSTNGTGTLKFLQSRLTAKSRILLRIANGNLILNQPLSNFLPASANLKTYILTGIIKENGKEIVLLRLETSQRDKLLKLFMQNR